MTKDEQFDNSMCCDFIKTKVVDMTDAVIKQFIEDLHVVIMERKPDAPVEPKSQFQTELAEVCELQREYYKERGIVF
jgi:hypothetical protein